jgi:hypothetical protein
MPTTLPLRRPPPSASADFQGFLRALICVYAIIAMVIASVVAIEHHFGMFTGMSTLEILMHVTGAEYPYSDPELIGMF